jgi:D-alanine-D-alanine ligase
MRIGLTFNQKRSAAEAEAEFDTLDTVHAIARTLASLGHVVTPIEVTRPVDEIVDELRRVAPDLVFNMAEGTRGTFREALLPALCEQLGLAHTGSSASVLALCMDKALAKRVVAGARVRTPWSRLVRSADDVLPAIQVPVIVKPNFEGSSKGITQASVVAEPAKLGDVVRAQLARYPSGVLVEEYIDGTDVAVGWVEGLGILPAIGYAYTATGPHRIYEYALKQGPAEQIDVQVPAALPASTKIVLETAARRAFDALGVTGYGRADFRITADGSVFFLEMNPLPTLDPAEKDLYAAAAAHGHAPRELLAAIVASATSAPEPVQEPEPAQEPEPLQPPAA